MFRTSRLLALVAVGLTGLAASPSPSQQPAIQYPRLEGRAAKAAVRPAGTDRRPGRVAGRVQDAGAGRHQDAINSVKAILGVTDLPGFRGVDRPPDFYKKMPVYKKLPVYPHPRAALGDLREAREELTAARPDFGGLKERAVDDIGLAVGGILTLLRAADKK